MVAGAFCLPNQITYTMIQTRDEVPWACSQNTQVLLAYPNFNVITMILLHDSIELYYKGMPATTTVALKISHSHF